MCLGKQGRTVTIRGHPSRIHAYHREISPSALRLMVLLLQYWPVIFMYSSVTRRQPKPLSRSDPIRSISIVNLGLPGFGMLSTMLLPYLVVQNRCKIVCAVSSDHFRMPSLSCGDKCAHPAYLAKRRLTSLAVLRGWLMCT